MGGSVELDAVVKFLRGRGRDDAAELVSARFASDRCAMIARIPPDTLAVAASWVARSDLLALRCAFAGGREAVRRAVPRHAECRFFWFRQGGNAYTDADDPRLAAHAIEAIGRVFGAGCRRLSSCGKSEAALSALRSFVANTKGGLEDLTLSNTAVSLDLLLELCGSCPRLEALILTSHNPLLTSAGAAEIAVRVSSSCPKLSRVYLPADAPKSTALSPAESWSVHFPNLTHLDLDAGHHDYTPSHFHGIEATLATCSSIREIEFGSCRVQRDLLEFLVRTPFGSRLTRLSVEDAYIEDATILAAAQMFSGLRDLVLPAERGCHGAFYENLYRARPELTRIEFGVGNDLTDACLKHVCDNFKLRDISIFYGQELSRNFVDVILGSPCSMTLQRAELSSFPCETLESRQLARLVTGCPALLDVTWTYDMYEMYSDDNLYEEEQCAIADLLASRGGKLSVHIFNATQPLRNTFKENTFRNYHNLRLY